MNQIRYWDRSITVGFQRHPTCCSVPNQSVSLFSTPSSTSVLLSSNGLKVSFFFSANLYFSPGGGTIPNLCSASSFAVPTRMVCLNLNPSSSPSIVFIVTWIVFGICSWTVIALSVHLSYIKFLLKYKVI